VGFFGGSFDEGCTHLFQNMFSGTSGLRSLGLNTEVEFSSSVGSVLAQMVGAHDSGLRELTLEVSRSIREFDVLLPALQQRSCQLESLILKENVGRIELQTLIQGIPRFRSLKTLDVHVWRLDFYLSAEDSFIEACWRNMSLETIRVGSIEPFIEGWKETLYDDFESIVARNRGLNRFQDKPTMLPLGLWNRVFARALECDLGHELINNTLRRHVNIWLEEVEKWKEENKKLKQKNLVLPREIAALKRQNEGLRMENASLKRELEKKGGQLPSEANNKRRKTDS
jgi:hypothetical protein